MTIQSRKPLADAIRVAHLLKAIAPLSFRSKKIHSATCRIHQHLNNLVVAWWYGLNGLPGFDPATRAGAPVSQARVAGLLRMMFANLADGLTFGAGVPLLTSANVSWNGEIRYMTQDDSGARKDRITSVDAVLKQLSKLDDMLKSEVPRVPTQLYRHPFTVALMHAFSSCARNSDFAPTFEALGPLSKERARYAQWLRSNYGSPAGQDELHDNLRFVLAGNTQPLDWTAVMSVKPPHRVQSWVQPPKVKAAPQASVAAPATLAPAHPSNAVQVAAEAAEDSDVTHARGEFIAEEPEPLNLVVSGATYPVSLKVQVPREVVLELALQSVLGVQAAAVARGLSAVLQEVDGGIALNAEESAEAATARLASIIQGMMPRL